MRILISIALIVILLGLYLSFFNTKSSAPVALETDYEATSIMLQNSDQSSDQAEDGPYSVSFFASEIDNYIDTPFGALDWHLFAQTKEIKQEGKTPDGFDYMYFSPEFPEALKEMNGQTIKIKGYMFPLDESEDQSLFLFGPFPLSCPFQYHVRPSLTIEAHADKQPIKFNYDPIIITGTLKLIDQDEENSTFYRLLDAKEVR